jgi:hypothetical protein
MVGPVLAIAGLGIGALTTLAQRERHRTLERRRAIFRPCAGLFDPADERIEPDGFPRLSGSLRGRSCTLSLFPDTLTVKRLPQLWLRVSMSSGVAFRRLAIIARPRGDEFHFAAAGFRCRLDVPSWLPADSSIHCADSDGEAMLHRLHTPLSQAFRDPRVKEVALGLRSFRLTYQLAEGLRGAHLLLRQANFEARLEPETLTFIEGLLLELETAAQTSQQRAIA